MAKGRDNAQEYIESARETGLSFMFGKIDLPVTRTATLLQIDGFVERINVLIQNNITIDNASVLNVLYNLSEALEDGREEGDAKKVRNAIKRLESVLSAENPQKGIENGTPTRSETDRRGT